MFYMFRYIVGSAAQLLSAFKRSKFIALYTYIYIHTLYIYTAIRFKKLCRASLYFRDRILHTDLNIKISLGQLSRFTRILF